MARKNDCWGIEVGQYAIKAMHLTRSGNHAELVDWDYLPFKQVLSTPDLNVDEAIQVGLDAFMTKHPDAERSRIVVSVPGHLAFARFAKLPPVEPKKIPSIVGYEAQQQIPFPIDQVEWDYQVFQQADSPDVEVGIFAITKERVMEFLSNYRAVGLRIDALTLSPLAVYNAFAYDHAEEGDLEEGSVYMDIGTMSTDVIIVESGGIWLRTLPIGGNHFTEALVKAFKISFSKAERYKREAATSKYSRQIFSAMRPVFADLVQEIQRSIGYYQSMNRDAELKQVVCVGSTFKLPGLSKFLKQQLGMSVVRPDKFERLDVAGKQEAEFSTRVLNLATAYGLALQGLGLERVSANVLPGYIIRQRVWRSKQPWIAAAAACVAIGAGLAGVRCFMEASAAATARANSEQFIRPIESEANRFMQQYSQIQGQQNLQRLENMSRILDYRHVWPTLLADITAAALATNPQPETLAPNYEQLQRIPRGQRRRIFIESIESQYLVGPDMTAVTGRRGAPGTPAGMQVDPTRLSTVHEAETFWTDTGADATMQTEDPAAGGAAPGGAAMNPASTGSTVPRFRITVRGWTPYQEPNGGTARFLNQTFLSYLQSVDAQSRPYKIVLGKEPILSLQQVPDDSRMSPRGRTTTRTPTRPGAAPPAGMGIRGMGAEFDPYGGGEFDVYGGMDPGAAARGRGGGAASIDALFPQRPLIEEDRTQDWQFAIQFTVELKRPEQARRTEPFARRQLTPPSEQPAQPQTPEPAPAEDQTTAHDDRAIREENPS